jgi:hypothetical protein
MNERTYQARLIGRIRKRFPECTILKNDPSYIQGIPDILILFRNRWAMLEVKMEAESAQQPNQDYYVGKFNEMSFASFINPSNEEEVLNDLQSAFGLTREARVS